MEPSADLSIWGTSLQKMEQNEGFRRMVMIGAELVLTCFLPTELIRSCVNMYTGKVKVKKALPKPKPEVNTNANTFELLDLPPEVREVIYNKVTEGDIKNLRQVSRQVLEEIDFMVGVKGILDDHFPGNLEWIQRVKLRSLRVINFRTPISNTSALAIPNSMKTIHAFPSPLSPSNLKAILQGAKTVRELTLHCFCGPESGPILTELLVAKSKEVSNIILDAIRFNYHLVDLAITMPPYSNGLEMKPDWDEDWDEEWDEEWDEDWDVDWDEDWDVDWDEDWEHHTGKQITGWQGYSRTLKSIRITAPFMSRESSKQWKMLFDQQTRLECVRCAMGPLHWSFYSKMLQNCCQTLKIIVLQDVQSFDPEHPFDWSILSQCQCLEVLHIMNKLEPHDEIPDHARFESIKFYSVNMANLRELTLMYVSLDENEFERIFNDAPKLEIINLLFVRRNMNFYFHPIISKLLQVLTKSNTIRTMIIADTPLFIDGLMEIFEDEVGNAVMLTKNHKYAFCDCQISSELDTMICPGVKIERLT